MLYLTSDWYLGEKRLGSSNHNALFRPFQSTIENDFTIVNNFLQSGFKNGDTLFFLGNVFWEITENNLSLFQAIKDKFPKSDFTLILGNLDSPDKMQHLTYLFDTILHDTDFKFYSQRFYLNHNPAECRDFISNENNKDIAAKYYCLTGTAQSLWKIQPQMINVGVDAWHFKPVCEDEIFQLIGRLETMDKNKKSIIYGNID